VAYDEDLAWRIRALLGSRSNLSEKKMFGGLAFLIGGTMALAAASHGGILVRVDPAERDELVRTTAAEAAQMGSRTMRGWVRVDGSHLEDDGQLRPWVERASAYAAQLAATP
jgi:TfoX/Sxy family transcriptional regulator of competence genes